MIRHQAKKGANNKLRIYISGGISGIADYMDRFEEAERKLKHSNDSISRIAYALGFKNDSNFIKFFKKNDIKKRTPKQFREEWG